MHIDRESNDSNGSDVTINKLEGVDWSKLHLDVFHRLIDPDKFFNYKGDLEGL